MTSQPRIVDVVFEQSLGWRTSRFLVAGLGAVALHIALFTWAARRGPSLEEWSAQLATRLHAELSRQEVIEVAKPAPEPPPPPPKPPVETPPPVVHKERRIPRIHAKPPPPAQAGKILAKAPRPDAPVDLTGETFVTGAGRYAGGVTSSAGKNETAVHTSVVDPLAPPTKNPAEPDLSSPVMLRGEEWQCPWPREADSAEIDQQAVVLRVVVNPDGTVSSAKLVSDPGYGFGAAAIECALHARFEPAKDSRGRPIRALSPPIRVKFRR